MMNKKDWELAIERLMAVRNNAQDNLDKAEKDLEEIDFMLGYYHKKVKSFPEEKSS